MYFYRLFEKKIASDLEFPYLVKDSSSGPEDIIIQSGDVPRDVLEAAVIKNYSFSHERSWLLNSTTWLIVDEGYKITYRLKEWGSVMKLRNYIMGFGMSMAAFQREELAMHCSAVSGSEGAILIAGKSGSGKSTLTASFLNAGYSLIADDMALVEPAPKGPVMVKPAFPYQKLCRDAALKQAYSLEELLYVNESKDKFLVPYKGPFSLKAQPVRALLILGTAGGSALDITQLQGLDKFYACTHNLFLVNFLGPKCYDPRLGQKLLQMAAGISVYTVSRPAGLDTAKELFVRCLSLAERELNSSGSL